MAKGLGKGLQAFFPEAANEKEEKVQEVNIKELRPNPYQPRKHFSEKSLEELKESIQNYGILQPLIVRKSIKGYEIVVGERRYRAAIEAGLKTVPVVTRDLTEEKMMELALIENLQREDLNPIEEAVAYEKLMQHLQVTQEQLATRLGKSRPHVANHLRLLQLPTVVQELIQDGKLSMGHGRALLGVKDKSKLSPLIEKVLQEKLSVRELERLVQKINDNVSRETNKTNDAKSPFLKSREESLRNYFGTSVTIKKGKRKGKIEIDFFSEDDLERILVLLDRENE
ncbi:ParB/RepB/Spo0J family partition protein [Alkalihalobacterium alkalinitrilicum]|uniref:ParB/RepB/Spo0J family partition protein n=1 Tax=Alkalihalobacterium alkalinitrilicum TaxID=427920 RepID=UPI000994CA0C|nr:ParB/RepB/Spo0J family partition protein [Alkalihalobacterium alkalinitrilicum]